MLINLTKFSGMQPRLSPISLAQEGAQTATNCLFGAGVLRPLLAGTTVTLTGNGTLNPVATSIFKYKGDRWLSWSGDVDVCASMVADLGAAGYDSAECLYWTDPNENPSARMADEAKILSATGYKPSSSFSLGIPKPTNAPVPGYISYTGDDCQKVTYCYTFVSKYGEEGPPSDPCEPISILPGSPVTLTMDDAPLENIATKNIYRSNTGSNQTDFQYVTSVSADAGLTTGETTLAADLSEICPSYTWFPPNAAVKGLTAHPSGVFIAYYNKGFSGVLCLSEPYLPHAWSQQIMVDAPIQGIGVFGTSFVVLTDSFPLVVTGSDPSSMSVERLETGEACTLKKGLVDMGESVIYPGVSGIWGVGTGKAALLTTDLMDKKEWDVSFSPVATNAMKFAARYGSQYVGFQTTGGFVLDTATGDFSTHSITADAAYSDPKTGDLYYSHDGALKKWGVGTAQSIVWKSKKFRLPEPLSFAVGQVYATGDVTVKIYADGGGSPIVNQTVTSSKPFRLPAGKRYLDWEVQLECACEVTEVNLATSMFELTKV